MKLNVDKFRHGAFQGCELFPDGSNPLFGDEEVTVGEVPYTVILDWTGEQFALTLNGMDEDGYAVMWRSPVQFPVRLPYSEEAKAALVAWAERNLRAAMPAAELEALGFRWEAV